MTPKSAQQWAVRLAAAGMLSTLALNDAVPDARAAELFVPQRTVTAPAATPAATLKKKRTKPAETYQERQQRIGGSQRSMLAPLAENKGKQTTCVSAEFTTLDVVFDSVVESLLPSLPPQLREAATANQAGIKKWMREVTVSTLAVSNNPLTRGADLDDPQYRTALSQLVVDDLLKIRDGKQNDAIPVANITLSQAVESVWLYVFVGILAPAKFGLSFVPSLGSPFSEPPLAATPLSFLGGFVTYNTLLSLGLTMSQLGMQYLYQGTSSAILNQCVAQVTEEQKERAGKPSEKVKYDIPIHPLIQGAADQLALADSDTCQPIGDLTLARIVTRTGDYAKSTAPNAATKRRIDAEVAKILRTMKTTRVPHNLIPADPADFSNVESIASFAGNMVPYIGGAPLDILIGLGHNIGQGDDMGEMVSLHDLTVTKSLTAAYYTYYFSLYLFTTVGGLALDPIYQATGIDPLPLSPVRVIGAVLGLPLTYGLVTFHHVVRSMCLIEDDTTGTGRGAEANKLDPAAHDKAVAAKKKADAAKATKSKAAKSKARQPKRSHSTPRQTPSKRTPPSRTTPPTGSATPS
ncbi:hypothetical protein [Gordonia sp. (in: high G+C Gram-positive bacteria)]|uniref:hypothetical protein n=1 Tax=Gordonia sp. (in: high G+C Gram-positive bacteria) TaxID=84139 RepID=UPI00263467A8|nr:hypothetical protein [Gordonia sp. (in: high G+C Gram-positive bacteria)]